MFPRRSLVASNSFVDMSSIVGKDQSMKPRSGGTFAAAGRGGGQRSKFKVKNKGHVPRSKVKCRHLADRPCTSGAPLRTCHELVLSKFVRLIF